ncbi:MAG TPA: methyltransferase domain-containing protein [Thermoanaerobaculia bacterium]|nr:methyltransferase domain-containing protein [Thermoanaerobaculia bacterium]
MTLLCPVRGCGEPLAPEERRLRCPRGHSFDVARSGYLNLLQPQDRRSATPGDSRAAAEARRRLYEAGHGAPLLAEVERQLAAVELPGPLTLLDVGCGEGSLLGALAARRPLAAHGLDISTPAVELAARRFAALRWIVANADRRLPFAAGSFDAVLVLSARPHRDELARVLAPHGRLIVATPAPDDLVELRAALLGEGEQRDRLERTVESLTPDFEVEDRASARHVATLDAAGVDDVLAATYRGARHSQQARLAELRAAGELRVTMSYDVARLRLRGERAR